MADEQVPLFSDSFPNTWIDASYQLMTREIQSLDKIVYGVVRAKGIAGKIFPSIKIPKGSKQHIVATEVEQEAPKFDDNFMKEDEDQVLKSEATFYPVFMHKDFSLYMTDIDASRSGNQNHNIDLKALTLRGSVGTIVNYKEKVIWRGYNISGRAHAAANNQGLIDTNSKGIMDTTNVQTCDVGAGGDSNITAAGDGPASIGIALADLVAYHYYGPYDFIMCPDTYASLASNQNTTTHIHDIERMQSMIDLHGNKLLRNLDVTPYLLGTVVSAATAAVMMFDRKTPAGEPTCVIGEEYPIAHYPTSQNALGVKGKVLWAGIPCVLRPYAFTQDAAITY
jgi:uncharacterized linocin/CFP29 family protein